MLLFFKRIGQVMGNSSCGDFEPDLQHRIPELLTIFRHVDGFAAGANHCNAVLGQYTLA